MCRNIGQEAQGWPASQSQEGAYDGYRIYLVALCSGNVWHCIEPVIGTK